MRAVVQRVSRARVRVDDESVGEIGTGLVVLVGFSSERDRESIGWLADKLWGLRIFADETGRMERSTADVGGSLLIVSQFTLYGDARKGKRPSFVHAAPATVAESLYEDLVAECREGGHVSEGRFGAMMEVELVNDGPVTILLER